MTTTTPDRVVAVTNGGSKRGFAYVVAAVYELKPRKDGTLTFRRSDTRYAWPHRSRRLATNDAVEVAERLGIPFWPDTRQHDTLEDALAKTPEAKAVKDAERKAAAEVRKVEILTELCEGIPWPEYSFEVKLWDYSLPQITVWQLIDTGCRFGNTYNSVEAAIADVTQIRRALEKSGRE